MTRSEVHLGMSAIHCGCRTSLPICIMRHPINQNPCKTLETAHPPAPQHPRKLRPEPPPNRPTEKPPPNLPPPPPAPAPISPRRHLPRRRNPQRSRSGQWLRRIGRHTATPGRHGCLTGRTPAPLHLICTRVRAKNLDLPTIPSSTHVNRSRVIFHASVNEYLCSPVI